VKATRASHSGDPLPSVGPSHDPVLGDLQGCHHRQIDHLHPALDPAVLEVLATAWTLLGRMIDPAIGPLQLETPVIVLGCSLPAGLLRSLTSSRLHLRLGNIGLVLQHEQSK
jgi:hypothetical protein